MDRERFYADFPGRTPIEAPGRIVLPYIHSNGTSLAALIDELAAVYGALERALTVLRNCTVNMRDFYPIGNDLYREYERQHWRRQLTLQHLQDEIQRQVEEMEKRNPDARR